MSPKMQPNLLPNDVNASKWEMPEFASTKRHGQSSAESINGLPTAKEIEEIRQTAQEEGFQQGYNDGQDKAGKELAKWRHDFDLLMNNLLFPLAEQEQQVSEEMAQLTMMITRQIIRREVQLNPEQIVAVVRESIQLLPSYRKQVAVQLHPEDARLIRKIFDLETDNPSGWLIIDDPSISRGGCVVTTDASNIDASVEKRMTSIFNHVFGDQRNLNDDTPST